MNWYNAFYWLTVSDGIKNFFDIAANIFTTISVISFIVLCITWFAKAYQVSENGLKDEAEDKVDPDVRSWEMARRLANKIIWPALALALITWLGYIATPTKKDMIFIIAGGSVGNFLSSDTSAKMLPSDLTKFLHLGLQKEIAELSDDARKELGLNTPRQELIDKVKTLTKDELIAYFSDSTIAKE